jgi:hypothetical protein
MTVREAADHRLVDAPDLRFNRIAPSISSAQFSTVPPQSKQKGGVSLQPPPKSMRGGAET